MFTFRRLEIESHDWGVFGKKSLPIRHILLFVHMTLMWILCTSMLSFSAFPNCINVWLPLSLAVTVIALHRCWAIKWVDYLNTLMGKETEQRQQKYNFNRKCTSGFEEPLRNLIKDKSIGSLFVRLEPVSLCRSCTIVVLDLESYWKGFIEKKT